MTATTDTKTEEPRKNLPASAATLIADAKNDITIPYFSGALLHQDDTLIQRGGGKGLKIYDEIERDTHAFAMLQKRKKSLLTREWQIKPASNSARDVEAANFCRDTLKALPFDSICEGLLDATLKGYAVSEIVWKRDGNRIVPEKVVSHDQRRFAFDETWRPRLLTWTNMRDGIELPERKFMVHRFGVKGNNPYGLGLGTRLFWPVLFKREGITFWLHFLEKFASPTVMGMTPYGTLSDEQAKLLNTLRQLRSSSAITVPIGTDIKFLEAARGGTVHYQDFLAYWDKQISITVTGETLTTDIGNVGSRAAAQTHEEMLALLVDSDADLLSDTLKAQLLTWLVDYNFPGAGVPDIWRVRAKNEKAEAEVGEAKAKAATAVNEALLGVLATAGQIDDDDFAREYITSFGLTDHLSDIAIDRLVEARFAFMDGGKRGRDLRQLADNNPVFAALFSEPRKKKLRLNEHVCFAARDPRAVGLADQLEEATGNHFDRRIDAIRRTLDDAADLPAAARAILELGAKWSPIALGTIIGDALQLAGLQGREAVFLDSEATASFAEVDAFNQPFKEQIDFFTQKRGKPTNAWTDAMRGVHDRSFVVAGATDLDMLSDFQSAIARAIEDGTTLEQFRQDFDRIVAKYGWSYKGEHGWRTRVIFETNIRTSYMAGRLKQMLDPDVVKLRPFWEYREGETRTPMTPRPLHLAWHGKVFRYDDPWWLIHFPPNDWFCSCGVRTLSLADLQRLGKDGPDEAPDDGTRPFVDPVTGKLLEIPAGVGYGWDYMPGAQWEAGLVPSALTQEGAPSFDNPRHAVEIDTPEPIADLIANAKRFKAEPMQEGLAPDEYVDAFLHAFGAKRGEAVLFTDAAGDVIPISEQLFRDAQGQLKVMKRGRNVLTPLMAETIMDPDEIWLGVARKPDPLNADLDELIVDRRYIRVDRRTGIQVVFEIGQRFWEPVTSYNPTTKKGEPDFKAVDKRRGGKLLYKRPRK